MNATTVRHKKPVPHWSRALLALLGMLLVWGAMT